MCTSKLGSSTASSGTSSVSPNTVSGVTGVGTSLGQPKAGSYGAPVPCPACGHCPTCGRTRPNVSPYQFPAYPNTWWQQQIQQTFPNLPVTTC